MNAKRSMLNVNQTQPSSLGWIEVVEGSESNVVGLPLELLADMLREFGV